MADATRTQDGSALVAKPARALRPGKRVRQALYVHFSALHLLSPKERAKIEGALTAVGVVDASGHSWNVVKLDPGSVSLLHYEDFGSVAFPRLLASARIDTSGRIQRTDYSARANPPILHRKELLLAPDDPRRASFAALTRSIEERGLFVDVHRIGTARAWAERLGQAGLTIEGDTIVVRKADDPPSRENNAIVEDLCADRAPPFEASSDGNVARHRTAIVRNRLSAPMQYLSRHGFVEEGKVLLDYGCGQGDDLRALKEGGIAANGWDPYFAPDGTRIAANTVNLGFVLNVIESLEERTATLQAAWSYCRRVMAVAVMIAGHRPTAGLKPYRDGFLTSRGTFQKYFTQDELREFIRTTIGVEPFAVAPGIMFVFRTAEDERDFVFRRQVRRIERIVSFRPPPRPRSKLTRTREPLRVRLLPVLEELWRSALELGREPAAEEIAPKVGSTLAASNVSIARAFALCRDAFDADSSLEEAGRLRRDDLVLAYALGAFSKSRSNTAISGRLRRDVRSFFGSARNAEMEGRAFLFSLGDASIVQRACEDAADAGLVHRTSHEVFHLHRDRRDTLPAVVRGFLGCASAIFGDLDDADILRIDIAKGTVVLYHLEDFDARLPIVIRIATINLKRQTIDDRVLEPRDRTIFLCRSCYTEDPAEKADRHAVEARVRAVLSLPEQQILVAKSVLEEAVRRGVRGS